MSSLFESWRERLQARHGHGSEQEEADLDQSSQTLLALLSSAVVVVGSDGQVVRSSPEAYRLAIVSQDRIIDPTVQEAVRRAWQSRAVSRFSLTTQTPQDFADSSYALRSQEASEGSSAPKNMIEMDSAIEPTGGVSRPNWLKVTVGRLSQQLVLVLIDDVSEAKRFEQTRDAFVQHVSEQLLEPVDELGALATSLQEAAQNAQQNSESLEQATAAVSRDAKTLRGYSAYLDHTLRDLLLLMRAQEPVKASTSNLLDLAEQVNAILPSLQFQAKEAGVGLDYQGAPRLQVHGEREQIQAAVRKLVENAIRYSPTGAKVAVVVGASKDGQYALIQVVDRGKGISKDEQEHIFERFYRGSNQTQSSQVGIGLGLAIVKHVALTHHGSVTLWSAPGQGSTFTLMLPQASQSPQAS
ncbi:two-component sensor histidine kinase [Bombiscardovia nodaiensis]|uniref:Sensor-like histidine kinase SenX3 n=1 Tax=Bombiscardovia nodaiensis TaxID=2932181 RepID=A0ABN6SCE5_9BIFI|nr:two-component sensor histidine kinase [Bombiscardovia nodaiensis]